MLKQMLQQKAYNPRVLWKRNEVGGGGDVAEIVPIKRQRVREDAKHDEWLKETT